MRVGLHPRVLRLRVPPDAWLTTPCPATQPTAGPSRAVCEQVIQPIVTLGLHGRDVAVRYFGRVKPETIDRIKKEAERIVVGIIAHKRRATKMVAL